MNNIKKRKKYNPWTWVPSLYFAEGLPYVIVMLVSVLMYKRLNISNADIALYTSWLYLPWVLKFLWSPFVDVIRTKRWWIITMQLLLGVSLGSIGLSIPASNFFTYTLIFFWLMAFSSATHDIAIDGFYMIGLSKHQQTFFVGIRSLFYRIAMITGQGALIILVGYLEESNLFNSNSPTHFAWLICFIFIAVLFVLFAVYHFFILPVEEKPTNKPNVNDILSELGKTIQTFFTKKNIIISILFLLTYRLGEAQLAKLATPFLLDNAASGGLSLSTKEVGFVYGTVGIIFLIIGGILGGFLASVHGLKFWIWWMVIAINIPNLVYVYLSMNLPDQLWIILTAVAIEQFGYGFGFTAYMLYMLYISDGKYKTSHFAFCTAFMALGMMLPGMFSGMIQEWIGYTNFFIWVMICTIPSFVMVSLLKIKKNFGRK